MKIGEAGEAFFVFETEDDVPEELITSPIIQATRPGEENAKDIPTDRFGARRPEEEEADVGEPADGNQEPDFLDLDASTHTPSEQHSTVDERTSIVSPPQASPLAYPSTAPTIMLSDHNHI